MSRRISKRSGVYQIVNEVNGKSYVGSSIDVENRWDSHRSSFKKPSKSRSILWNAVQKHGIQNFTFTLLEECERVKEVLLQREQHYIDILKPEYNLMPIAGSRLGSKASPEQIAAQSERMKARMNTPAWEAQMAVMSAAVKKYMNDPEVKEFYRALRQGKSFEQIFGVERAKEILARQSVGRTGKHVGFDPWNKGVPADPAHIQRMIDARDGMEPWNKGTHGLMPEPWNKGIEPTPEMLVRLIEIGFQPGHQTWNKDMVMSEEHCQRMSEIAKANFDPEHQARMTEAAAAANRGQHRSQETREKIRESNLVSDARKAHTEKLRGVPRSTEVNERISAGIRSSEKFQASVCRRIGKVRADNTSGHYGIVWDKQRGKWMVRVNKKQLGRFDTIEEALERRRMLTI